MLELELAGVRKQHVDDDALGRGEQHSFDELFVFVVAGVGADQLHLRARQRHVEHSTNGRDDAFITKLNSTGPPDWRRKRKAPFPAPFQ